MCLFSLYSWLRQVRRGIRWLRGWSCSPHFLMEVPGKVWSPMLEPWPQCPVQWKWTDGPSITVSEGEKSSFCLLYFNSSYFPNEFAVHKRLFIGCAVQSHHSSSLVLQGMADDTKRNGKICKAANSSRGFRARLAKHKGHLCNTC